MAANYGRNSCDTQIFESFCKLLRKQIWVNISLKMIMNQWKEKQI
jgi:hypothetical protein